MASLDLKDVCWHLLIHPCFQMFLAFQIEEDCFQCIRLLFGLSIATRVFSRLTQIVAAKLAAKGMDTQLYLNDWLVVSPSQPEEGNRFQSMLHQVFPYTYSEYAGFFFWRIHEPSLECRDGSKTSITSRR